MRIISSALILGSAVCGSNAFSTFPSNDAAAFGRTAKPLFAASSDENINTRRSALKSLGGTAVSLIAASTAACAPAFAEESADDLVARIAAKSVAANDAARVKREADEAKRLKDKEGGGSLVLGVGAAGVVLTLPFFLPNLLRLGSKLGSGGKDDGYGK